MRKSRYRQVSTTGLIFHTVTHKLCDMKNITLAIDEDVLAVVRRYSAEPNCSVNSLVREYLTNIAKREDRARQARKNIRMLSENSTAKMESRTWSRDDLYER